MSPVEESPRTVSGGAKGAGEEPPWEEASSPRSERRQHLFRSSTSFAGSTGFLRTLTAPRFGSCCLSSPVTSMTGMPAIVGLRSCSWRKPMPSGTGMATSSRIALGVSALSSKFNASRPLEAWTALKPLFSRNATVISRIGESSSIQAPSRVPGPFSAPSPRYGSGDGRESRLASL